MRLPEALLPQNPTWPKSSHVSQVSSTILTETITSKIKIKSQDFEFSGLVFFRKCGLLLWLVLAPHDHFESKCERKSGKFICFSITKAKATTNPQIFICNRFCVDGSGFMSGVARGLLQGRTLQLPRGVDQELANFWATLCTKSWAVSYCFLLPRMRTKSGWLEVDQELDMGCQLLARTFLC